MTVFASDSQLNFQDKSERKRLMYEAYKMAQRALEFEDEDSCFGAHKW